MLLGLTGLGATENLPYACMYIHHIRLWYDTFEPYKCEWDHCFIL